jgi:hypothetical protein
MLALLYLMNIVMKQGVDNIFFGKGMLGECTLEREEKPGTLHAGILGHFPHAVQYREDFSMILDEPVERISAGTCSDIAHSLSDEWRQ